MFAVIDTDWTRFLWRCSEAAEDVIVFPDLTKDRGANSNGIRDLDLNRFCPGKRRVS